MASSSGSLQTAQDKLLGLQPILFWRVERALPWMPDTFFQRAAWLSRMRACDGLSDWLTCSMAARSRASGAPWGGSRSSRLLILEMPNQFCRSFFQNAFGVGKKCAPRLKLRFATIFVRHDVAESVLHSLPVNEKPIATTAYPFGDSIASGAFSRTTSRRASGGLVRDQVGPGNRAIGDRAGAP